MWILLDLPKDEQLIRIATEYFNKYGLVTILIASLTEGTLLIGWYAPAGLVIFLGVILSSHDPKQVFLSICMNIIGFICAYSFNYFMGRYGWYKVLLRLGARGPLERAQKNFDEYGMKAIYMSYWSPNLASLISTASGIARAPLRKFSVISSIATILWSFFWGTTAYLFGPKILNYLGAIFVAVMAGWIVYTLIKNRTALFNTKKLL